MGKSSALRRSQSLVKPSNMKPRTFRTSVSILIHAFITKKIKANTLKGVHSQPILVYYNCTLHMKPPHLSLSLSLSLCHLKAVVPSGVAPLVSSRRGSAPPLLVPPRGSRWSLPASGAAAPRLPPLLLLRLPRGGRATARGGAATLLDEDASLYELGGGVVVGVVAD